MTDANMRKSQACLLLASQQRRTSWRRTKNGERGAARRRRRTTTTHHTIFCHQRYLDIHVTSLSQQTTYKYLTHHPFHKHLKVTTMKALSKIFKRRKSDRDSSSRDGSEDDDVLAPLEQQHHNENNNTEQQQRQSNGGRRWLYRRDKESTASSNSHSTASCSSALDETRVDASHYALPERKQWTEEERKHDDKALKRYFTVFRKDHREHHECDIDLNTNDDFSDYDSNHTGDDLDDASARSPQNIHGRYQPSGMSSVLERLKDEGKLLEVE